MFFACVFSLLLFCHLGAIAATMKWGGAEEGGLGRGTAEGGGGLKGGEVQGVRVYSTIQCTYKLHGNGAE
jgi:hypothetical protein